MLRRALKAIFGNFRLKVWALIISLGIWFYANSQVTDEAIVRAALHITCPSDYELLYQSEEAVRVSIVGPRALVSRVRGDLAQNYLQFTYNLAEADLADGWATLRVDADWLRPRLPEQEFVQLKLRDISPPEVQVFGSPIKERVVPVEVKASVHPAPGFHLTEPPFSSPSRVKVRGPAIAVDSIEAVATAELALFDIRARIHRPVSLQDEIEVALDNGARVPVALELSPSSVVANIYVTGEEEREQEFADLPVLLLKPPGFPYVAELGEGEGRVSVTVKATPPNLRKLKRESIQVCVDLVPLANESIELGSSAPYKERVRVLLPPGVSYREARAQPEHVTLLLKNPAD